MMREVNGTDLLVQTSSGLARGFLDRGVPHWRGVPYGRVTERFRPPSPLVSDDVVGSTAWGPVSWQVPIVAKKSWSFVAPDSVEGEDCLNLNLWSTAGERADRNLPVMVWLHPGGHVYGSGNMPSTDPWTLVAQHDVVVVTANYRLGPWGWLYLGACDPEYKDSANLPILDQVLLLKWVRDNIAQFGGDPANITIFGASSGASDVATLLGVPAAQGLFHKAAIYSGSADDPVSATESADRTSRFLAAAAPLAASTDELVRLPNAGLRRIHRNMLREERVRYGPFIDGTIIPAEPLRSIADGMIANVPVLVSVTSNEAVIYDAFSTTAVDEMYADLGGTNPDAEHDEKIGLLSQKLYIEPAQRLMDAIDAGGGSAWSQVFHYLPSTAPAAAYKGVAGRAVHGADLTAIFADTRGQAGNDTDRAVAADEQSALIALVTEGHPGWPRATPGLYNTKWIAPPGVEDARSGGLP